MTHDSDQEWNNMLALDFSLLYCVFVTKEASQTNDVIISKKKKIHNWGIFRFLGCILIAKAFKGEQDGTSS